MQQPQGEDLSYLKASEFQRQTQKRRTSKDGLAWCAHTELRVRFERARNTSIAARQMTACTQKCAARRCSPEPPPPLPQNSSQVATVARSATTLCTLRSTLDSSSSRFLLWPIDARGNDFEAHADFGSGKTWHGRRARY